MIDHKNTAKKILLQNRYDDYTVPSKNLYKHQWSWDSGWITFGLNLINEEKHSEKELIHLFSYQWSNGLIPSIIFNTNDIDYFPGPNIWEVSDYAGKYTKNNNSTGIVQPPIHSYAVLNTFKITKNINFLKDIFPKLLLWHQYLYNERDIYDEGLVYIRHPWESGMDNSPIWDESLNRIYIDDFKYSKMRVDNKKVNSDERPTDLTYEKYIRLIEIFKECKYNEKDIFQKSELIIQDVLFNVLLQKSNIALREIAQILGYNDIIPIISNWINKTNFGIENKFFHKGFYYDYDLIGNKYIEIKTITGLTPLAIFDNKYNLIQSLKNNFLDISNNNYNIASIDRSLNLFDPINYWRGPAWVNLTWLILSSVKKYDFDLYLKIKNNIIQKIEKIGFYEYFNSNDILHNKSSGIGDNFFSWTASIYLCLISNFEF